MRKEQILEPLIKYRLYIFSLVAGLSSIILIAFVLIPQTGQLISNQKTEKDVTNKSEFLEAKAAELESYDTNDLSLKVRNALNSYPVERDLITVMSLLQGIVTGNGFKVTTINVAGGSARENSQSFSIKMEIIGPKDSLPSLLQAIESSPRLMRVASVDAAIGRDAGAAAISVDVDVLYAGAPSEFGSVDSPLPELSQKEEEVLATLAAANPQTQALTVQQSGTGIQATGPLPPRGKENPFE